MKKILLFVLVALVGISLTSFAFADEARTIPMKSAVVLHADTLAVGHGGTLYRVSGRATSSSAAYVVYDVAALATAQAVATSTTNILAEGGEATQYDNFDTIDFGSEGIDFKSGLAVITTTCDVLLQYR